MRVASATGRAPFSTQMNVSSSLMNFSTKQVVPAMCSGWRFLSAALPPCLALTLFRLRDTHEHFFSVRRITSRQELDAPHSSSAPSRRTTLNFGTQVWSMHNINKSVVGKRIKASACVQVRVRMMIDLPHVFQHVEMYDRRNGGWVGILYFLPGFGTIHVS